MSPYVDPMQAQRHGRLNIIFKSPMAGDESACGIPIFARRRVRFLRLGIGEYSVTRVISGRRCVLSLGCALRNKMS
jgi:hypothetical protein